MCILSKKQSLYSLVFVLLGGSNLVFSATTDLSYEEIFGIDDANQQNNQPEELITPLIILGVKKTTLIVNVDQYSKVVSFESKPFLEHIALYLKPEIVQQLKQLSKAKFIQNNQLPSGIKVRVNDALALEVDIDKGALTDISPTLGSKPFNRRKPLDTPIISSVHDVDLTLAKNNNTKYENKVVVDTTLRINRALLSGTSTYLDRVSNFFNENWIAQYEDTDKSYFYGYLQSPSFANLNPKKLAKGFAVGNTDLKDNITFVSDARYVDLVYPATVKIYIDNLLHEEKSFAAGRHRLNIPLQSRLFEVRVEVKDIYGREKSYDFSSYSGPGVENIPLKNNYSYFVSYGSNDELKMQFYGGVELGLSSLSKAQVAINHVSSNMVIAGKYYQIIPLGSISSTLSLNHGRNKDNGYSLKTESLLDLNPKLSLDLSHIYENNLDTNSGSIQNQHLLRLGVSYHLNKQWRLNGILNYEVKERTSDYTLTGKYQLNKATALKLSYYAPKDSESYAGVNLSYKFGKDGSSINSQYRDDTKEAEFNLNYNIDDKNSTSFVKNANYKALKHQYKDDIFKTKIEFNQKDNGEKIHEINTQFSIVSAEDLVSIAPALGKYNGFSIIEASEQFVGELGLSYRGSECKLRRLQRCILILKPEQQLNLRYQKDLIPLGVSIDPPEISIRVPERGGVKQYLSSKINYFVEGVLVEKSLKPIQLTLGTVRYKNGPKVDTFTDEDGLFFLELTEGDQTLTMPGYQSFDFNVNKEKLKDGVINIGTIQLQKLNQ